MLFAPSNDGLVDDETDRGDGAATANDARDAASAAEPVDAASAEDAGEDAPRVCSNDIVPTLSLLGTAGGCGGPGLPISLRRGLAFQLAGNNVGGCILADFGVPIPAVEIVASVETEGACGACDPSPCSKSSMDVYAWRTNEEDAENAIKVAPVGTSQLPFVVTLPFETAKVAVCVAREGTALRVSSLHPVCR